jgi:hypothetical protein
MTEPATPAQPTPEAPAATTEESSEEDDDSLLDSLIESITEIPHWLFRPIFGRGDDGDK